MKIYDLAIVGFGVIGTEALYKLKKLASSKKKINVAIIEKDLKNIPGGVAYSIDKSKYGFFNNPLRLSHHDFIIWISKKKNLEKCCKLIDETSPQYLVEWKNKIFKNFSTKNFLETYFPRYFYSIYLKEKIIDTLSFKKNSFKIDLYIGSADIISKHDNLNITSNKSFKNYFMEKNQNELRFVKKIKNIKKIITKKIILGLGLLPPKKIETNFYKHKDYIWDFYVEGGTKNLERKIRKLIKIKKIINLVFIGNKAGLLETMQKLDEMVNLEKIKINITCIAPKKETLQKALHSKNFEKYKFNFLTNKKIKNIKFSDQIFSLIKNEFNYATKNDFNKYDVWTLILKRNILKKIYKELNTTQRQIYNSKTFNQIRKITRYTYPETVFSKEKLEKMKKIKFVKDKVKSIKRKKDNFKIKTEKNKIYFGNIINNVSGPVNIDQLKTEDNLIYNLKKLTNKYDKSGFKSDSFFMVYDNIFIPGIISNNFNPARETIIKAITNNVSKVIKKIIKKI